LKRNAEVKQELKDKIDHLDRLNEQVKARETKLKGETERMDKFSK
jgi:hypothetical protein